MTSLSRVFLSTDRLTIRPATCTDLSDYVQINGDEKVRKWIGDGSTINAEQTRKRVEVWDARVKDNDPFTAYPARLKSDGTFVGSVHFTPSDTPIPGMAALSYMFVHVHQSQKFCSEATAAFMYEHVYDLSVEKTPVHGAHLQTVEATARKDNIPSNRVLQKLGFVFQKTIQKAGWSQDRLYYLLDLTSAEYITCVVSRLLNKMKHPLNHSQVISIISGYLAEIRREQHEKSTL